jgi:hypothetical protein
MISKHLIRALICLACLANPMPFLRGAALEPDVAALADAKPDAAAFRVANLLVVRDAFTMTLRDGTLCPLRAQDRVIGAVFLGHGVFRLAPASVGERSYLALRAERKRLETLEDTFEKAVLLFSDTTWDDFARTGTPAGVADAGPVQSLLAEYAKREMELGLNLHLRAFADRLEAVPPERGFWSLYFKGKELSQAFACFDPRGLPTLGFDPMFGTETTTLVVLRDEPGPVWYSSTPKGSPRLGPWLPPVEAVHYGIDTTIAGDLSVSATTTIQIKARESGARLVNLGLCKELRIRRATYGSTTCPEAEIPFLQADLGKRRGASWACVVLPRPTVAGEEGVLTVSYAGTDILENAGGDNYYVLARNAWYPNLGSFANTALFDLTFRTPKDKDVISISAPVAKRVEGMTAIHTFASDHPIRVAGFNYGTFDCIEREDSDLGMSFRVYTNRGDSWLAAGSIGVWKNPIKFRENTLIDAINAARIGSVFFGPPLARTVAISQQAQWNFGQSWPSLVFLPITAFTASSQRVVRSLHISGSGNAMFQTTVGYHELSHQWWGHDLGWATYRDQWLSEGFAEFSSGLSVLFADGEAAFRELLDEERWTILQKAPSSWVKNTEAGPIDLGFRLVSKQAPHAYEALVYRKGAFVLHMLRSMLNDPKGKDPDARFKAILKDFLASMRGKAATTEDFRAVVARHVDPKVFGDMRWFFDQWVYGTEVPKLAQKLNAKEMGDGVYRISGELTQTGVSASFRSWVPVFVELEKGTFYRLGQVALRGEQTFPVDFQVRLPKAPLSVEANVFHNLLTRD